MTDDDRPADTHQPHICPHCRAHGLTTADWDNAYRR